MSEQRYTNDKNLVRPPGVEYGFVFECMSATDAMAACRLLNTALEAAAPSAAVVEAVRDCMRFVYVRSGFQDEQANSWYSVSVSLLTTPNNLTSATSISPFEEFLEEGFRQGWDACVEQQVAALSLRNEVLTAALKAIEEYEPFEVKKDAYAYGRMVESYRKAARAALLSGNASNGGA